MQYYNKGIISVLGFRDMENHDKRSFIKTIGFMVINPESNILMEQIFHVKNTQSLPETRYFTPKMIDGLKLVHDEETTTNDQEMLFYNEIREKISGLLIYFNVKHIIFDTNLTIDFIDKFINFNWRKYTKWSQIIVEISDLENISSSHRLKEIYTIIKSRI